VPHQEYKANDVEGVYKEVGEEHDFPLVVDSA